MTGESRRGPLAGVRVIEVATYITGPYAALQLGDLGADVIKIEPPKGDPFRTFGRPRTYVAAQFASVNRGKRSVVLNLKDEVDRTRFLELLSGADVFLTNWRPGVAERLGLADAVLAATNPRLIRMFISGFGNGGPAGGEPAFDNSVQARSAMMDALSMTEVPNVVPGWPIDKITALIAVQAILAALFQRERAGLGEHIHLSMLDSAIAFNFPDLFARRTFLDEPIGDAHDRQLFAVRPLPASDGHFVVAPVTLEHIRAMIQVAGHSEWEDDLISIMDPTVLLAELFDRLRAVTPSATVAHWVEGLRACDVACSPCTKMDDLFDDSQVIHNRMFHSVDWGEPGEARVARYPAILRSWGPLVADRRPPPLGADDDEVLGCY